jgi:hypothetical protein
VAIKVSRFEAHHPKHATGETKGNFTDAQAGEIKGAANGRANGPVVFGFQMQGRRLVPHELALRAMTPDRQGASSRMTATANAIQLMVFAGALISRLKQRQGPSATFTVVEMGGRVSDPMSGSTLKAPWR